MKAAFYRTRGPASEVFEIADLPTPEPSSGEVLVRVATSGVNPSDWKSRSGLTTSVPLTAPVIPHSDGAGVITQVGAGVDAARVGQRVWLWNGQWQRSHGTAAEFIALPANQAVPLPDNTDFAEGACLGIPAMTAAQAVKLSNLHRGDTALVHGGAGAVSQYVIQFCKHRGIRVITTISNSRKAETALAVGADVAINYVEEAVSERVQHLTQGRGVDAIIDLNYSANASLVPLVLKPHGTVVVYGTNDAQCSVPALWMMRSSITVKSFLVYELSATDRTQIIEELSLALQSGMLKHHVAAELPLASIAQAHDLVQQGALIGNLVLRVDSASR